MLLKQAAGCDPCSSEEITKKTAILEGLYLDDLVWINPFDTEANQKRKAVQVAIERMKRKPLGDIVAKINTELKGLIADSASYEPAGVVMDKAQDIRLGATVENGVLYVLRTDSQQKTSFHRFGEVTKGQAKTDRAAKGLDPTGTLVFVKRSK
jgi:hypothetical protein